MKSSTRIQTPNEPSADEGNPQVQRSKVPETRGRIIHWAPYYDLATKTLLLGQEGAIRQMTIEMAGIKPGEVVLDVGCGTGSLTVLAKQRAGSSGEVYGIDPAPEMIEVASLKAAKAGIEVSFQVGLIEELPFPEQMFDLVLSSLMLHHLPEDLKQVGFTEVWRVLKPGGRFFAVDFKPPESAPLRHLASLMVGHQMMHGNVGELIDMLKKAGFTAVEEGKTSYRLFSYLRGVAEKK